MTSDVRQQLLDQNEGFELKTKTSMKNLSEHRHCRITGGELRIRSSGKTSWADSRFEESVASSEQTHRFLREHLLELNTDGL
ncbi:hypothetical protein [Streptomyces cyaneofuscatus]